MKGARDWKLENLTLGGNGALRFFFDDPLEGREVFRLEGVDIEQSSESDRNASSEPDVSAPCSLKFLPDLSPTSRLSRGDWSHVCRRLLLAEDRSERWAWSAPVCCWLCTSVTFVTFVERLKGNVASIETKTHFCKSDCWKLQASRAPSLGCTSKKSKNLLTISKLFTWSGTRTVFYGAFADKSSLSF